MKNKFVCFCADNANTNFDGRSRGGTSNIFYKLKCYQPSIVGIGCSLHILHNALKHVCDKMKFDVESTVVKIYSHFYIYTVRVDSLRTFCEQAGIHYRNLLGYAKTRFLALGGAIKSIFQIYNGVKAYFEEANTARMLDEFFQNPFSKFWLLFLSDQVCNIE